jgi:hypothetical protein
VIHVVADSEGPVGRGRLCVRSGSAHAHSCGHLLYQRQRLAASNLYPESLSNMRISVGSALIDIKITTSGVTTRRSQRRMLTHNLPRTVTPRQISDQEGAQGKPAMPLARYCVADEVGSLQSVSMPMAFSRIMWRWYLWRRCAGRSRPSCSQSSRMREMTRRVLDVLFPLQPALRSWHARKNRPSRAAFQ